MIVGVVGFDGNVVHVTLMVMINTRLTLNGDGHRVLNDMRLNDWCVCSVYISMCFI